MRRLFRFAAWGSRPDDPGPAWAEEVLRPLRDLRAEAGVAPVVMARVRALSGAPVSRRPARPPRTLMSAAFAFGGATAAALVATVVVLFWSGDEGARALLATIATLGQTALLLWERTVSIAWSIASAARPLLTALLTIARAAAPLLRGAFLAVALCGAASIVFSVLVFARVRTQAAGIPLHGGLR